MDWIPIGYQLDTYYSARKIEPINKPQRIERFLPMNSSRLRRPSVKTEMPSITDDGMGRRPTGTWVRITSYDFKESMLGICALDMETRNNHSMSIK